MFCILPSQSSSGFWQYPVYLVSPLLALVCLDFTFCLLSSIDTTIGGVSPKSVLANLSSKFARFLAERSQFDTGHRVDFYAHTCYQPATFGPLFALYIVLCFYGKKLTMSQFATDAIFRCDLYARCRHRRLLIITHNSEQLRTTTHNGRLYSFILALRVKFVRPCQLQRIICSICSRFHVVIAARASHQTFIVVYQSINQSINQSLDSDAHPPVGGVWSRRMHIGGAA